jgi:hypothetical protein
MSNTNVILSNEVDENEMSLDGADYILGIGKKKKPAPGKDFISNTKALKATMLSRIADKKVVKGDLSSAQKAHNIAVNKASTLTARPDVNQQLTDSKARIEAEADRQQQFLNEATVNLNMPQQNLPLDPITAQDAPVITGGGGSMDDLSSGVFPGIDGIQDDEPTGNLAQEKELENVTVTGVKKASILPLILGAIVIAAIMYFLTRKKK